VITQALGAATALLFNAVSYLVSAACLLAIRPSGPRPEPRRPPPGLRREIAAGLRLVFADPYLRQLSLFGGLANFALDGYAAVVVVFLVRAAGLSAGPVGVLIAMPGIGGLTGALLARRVSARLGTARTMLASTSRRNLSTGACIDRSKAGRSPTQLRTAAIRRTPTGVRARRCRTEPRR